MENESNLRRRRTPAERAQILDQYHQCGLTQKLFAAQVGISYSALSSWLRQAAAKSDGTKRQFVAVPNLLPAARGSAAYRLQWPDGVVLEVGAGFAAPELGTLLQVMRRL